MVIPLTLLQIAVVAQAVVLLLLVLVVQVL
jgi:hypothetical protein